MSSQNVPIHRTNTDAASSKKKDDSWFNAFDYAPGQDANIRWLSRPNQQAVQGKYSRDTEKFRISFDVENFKAEQIKVHEIFFSYPYPSSSHRLDLHSTSSFDYFRCL